MHHPSPLFKTAISLMAIGGCILVSGMSPAQAQSDLRGIDIGPYPGPAPNARSNPGIATGSPSGLYIRMAEDMASLCAKPRDSSLTAFRLNVVATEGGLDSVKRLRMEGDVQMAIAQSDLFYYARQASDATTTTGSWLPPKTRESWLQIAEDTRLIVPLFTEKIHIVVTPSGKTRFQDLMGLFRSKARVSVGTTGSGSMITCSLIEDMILRHMKAKGEPQVSWKPHYLPAEPALAKLVSGEEELDAVILVGGVPYPALEKFAMNHVNAGFLKGNVSVPQLTLLPFGKEADAAVESDPGFKGYVPTVIGANEYPFLAGEDKEIATRGVTACLVTHKAYTADGKTVEGRQKLLWVRHVVLRMLSNLDQSSESGLTRQFGTPQGGTQWKEVWGNLLNLETAAISWESYGWKRHDDPVLRQMVDTWAKRYETRPAASRVIDPDR